MRMFRTMDKAVPRFAGEKKIYSLAGHIENATRVLH
jgi:hypothetical protein